ncbi:MAG: hypothetical protein IOB84_13575 [Brevundimonas sp.]|nr:hypothetical protein [Brevundimonas sp.]
MTNDLIERLRAQAAYDRAHYPPANPLFSEAAAHIEALAERVRELEGALGVADDALRGYACCGLGNACIRSPDQCRAECGQPAGLALDAIASARQARSQKAEKGDG